MKNLVIAFGVATAASVVLLLVVHPFISKDEVATSIAILPFVSVCHICEMLERSEGRKSLAPYATAKSKEIQSFDGFSIPWMLMLGYGALALIGVMNLASLCAGFLTGMLTGVGATFGNEEASIAILGLPIGLVGGFFVGKWVGSRCTVHGVVVVVLIAVIGVGVAKVVDFAWMGSDAFEAFYGAGKEEMGRFLLQSMFGMLLYVVAGTIGYWRGRHNRLAKYLRYLVGVLPRDTRDSLVGLAYDEARAVAHRQTMRAA